MHLGLSWDMSLAPLPGNTLQGQSPSLTLQHPPSHINSLRECSSNRPSLSLGLLTWLSHEITIPWDNADPPLTNKGDSIVFRYFCLLSWSKSTRGRAGYGYGEPEVIRTEIPAIREV